MYFTFTVNQNTIDDLNKKGYTADGGGVDCHVMNSNSTGNKLEFECTSSCARLFFTGSGISGGSNQQLMIFVMVPLMWVPFAVYCNNEVSQLIDGLWFQHQGRHHHHLRLAELEWSACLEAADVPYALTLLRPRDAALRPRDARRAVSPCR